MEGALRRRPANHRQDAAHERRASHHYWRGSRRLFRNICRLGHEVLGAGLHGRHLRGRRLQTPRLRGGIGRAACRGRGEILGGGGSFKKKKKKSMRGIKLLKRYNSSYIA